MEPREHGADGTLDPDAIAQTYIDVQFAIWIP
jgi:hypothetical protein